MYAIVDIAGQQFKVSKSDKVFVHRQDAEIGTQVEFKNVLLLDNEKEVEVGTPQLSDISILAEVVEHVKGDKVLVFHKKRRKGYQKLNGHRQQFTRLNILSIMKNGSSLTGENAESAIVKNEEVVAAPKAKKTVKAAEKAAPAEKKAPAKKATTAKKSTKKEE